MAQLGDGVRNFSPRGVGAAHNNCSLIKPSTSLLRCSWSRCQSLCNCRIAGKELPRSSGDLWTCSCSRFGASVPHLRAASRATMFLTPLTSLQSRGGQPPPTRLGSQSKFAGSPIITVRLAGRCWWHNASQVLRPCRAVTTSTTPSPTLLLRLDRVGLGSFGRGGDLQKSKRCCDAAVGGPGLLWEHQPKPA